MRKQNILILLQCLNLVYVFCDGTYECGEHGRFEYCIDEIPGCIVGCYCHPGYYFDTDTKICEPNSKLIEHHRRNYVAEPTRVQNHIMTPNHDYVTSSAATTSKIDVAVDEISKDTEDLGDWLYNQFFKTIENQVINSTNNENMLTRRSASAKSMKRPKRRKKIKKHSKSRQRGKKDNMKQKLLRITENDSVFDLSSNSNSDSSDSTSSSSDSSLEYDRYRHDDDEYGHKKIVMIKKKPKDKLPNFIFLPNLETPFYPPMGLPPPPIPVPMYPMVPVPPMVPFYHIEEIETTTVSDKTTTVSNTTTTTTTTTTSTTKTTSLPSSSEQEKNQLSTKKPEQSEEKEPIKLNHRDKKRRKEIKSLSDRTGNDLRSMKMMSPSRQKILQHLKQKINNQSAKSLMPPWMKNKNIMPNSFIKQDANYEHPYIENSPDYYMINDIKSNTREDRPTMSENVDFKYISELIHRNDLNNDSNKLPPIEYNPLDSIEVYQSPIQKRKKADYIVPPDALDNRRSARPNYHKSDDSYYMNLGRQIASMIRGLDSQNKELSIKLEPTHDIPKNDVFVKVNSPRSYWERSVRSPLTFLNSNKKNVEYLKRSNELLFDIENKVEIIASTEPTLTLREIENIVSIMETAKTKMQDKETIVKDVMLPGNNVNIHLWPPASSNTRNLITNTISANLRNSIKIPVPSSATNNVQNKKSNIPDNLHGFSMAISNRFTAQQNPQPAGTSNFNSLIMETKSKIKPVSYVKDHIVSYYQGPQQTLPKPRYTKPTFSDQNLRQSLWDHEMNPLFLKHRKYFDNSRNHFAKFPYNAPRSGAQNSYFHHEINNFDHID